MLIDTNAVLAMLNRKDVNHELVQPFIKQAFLVLMTIIPEVDYLATKYIGDHAARAFIKSLARREKATLGFDQIDLERTHEVMNQYPDVPLGFVDASLVALAERHQIQKILTFDRRHFSLIRPKNLAYFELLP